MYRWSPVPSEHQGSPCSAVPPEWNTPSPLHFDNVRSFFPLSPSSSMSLCAHSGTPLLPSDPWEAVVTGRGVVESGR